MTECLFCHKQTDIPHEHEKDGETGPEFLDRMWKEGW